MNHRYLFLSAALAFGLLAGCTRPVKVESTWSEVAQRNESFRNVLVVGVTGSYNLRCRFERVMAAALRSDTVEATTSCAQLTSKDPLTRDTIVPLVVKTGADAVLVTELLGAKAKMVEGGTDEARGEAYFKPTGYGYAYNYSYYGAFGVPVTYVDFTLEEAAFSLERTVAIATNLFRAQDAALLYSLRTTVNDATSREEVLEGVTMGVADQMRSDGLLR